MRWSPTMKTRSLNWGASKKACMAWRMSAAYVEATSWT
jgi:hypothetical protein